MRTRISLCSKNCKTTFRMYSKLIASASLFLPFGTSFSDTLSALLLLRLSAGLVVEAGRPELAERGGLVALERSGELVLGVPACETSPRSLPRLAKYPTPGFRAFSEVSKPDWIFRNSSRSVCVGQRTKLGELVSWTGSATAQHSRTLLVDRN